MTQVASIGPGNWLIPSVAASVIIGKDLCLHDAIVLRSNSLAVMFAEPSAGPSQSHNTLRSTPHGVESHEAVTLRYRAL